MLWSFESLKIADISTCHQFSAVLGLRGSGVACAVAVACVSFCSVLGVLFAHPGHFHGGSVLSFGGWCRG